MTQRNWRDDDALTLGVFLNGSEIPTQSPQGAPVIDDTFLILFNAWDGRDRLHAPGRLVRPPLDARALDRRARSSRPARRSTGARRRPGRGPLARRAPPSRLDGLSCAPPTGSSWGRSSASARRASSSRTCATSASRTSTSPPRSRPAPARRTATTSSTRRSISEDLGGEDEFRALCSAAQDAGLGVVLDIVPNHMATSDENPFWRDPLWRAKFFDLDWRTGAHRRFFDVGELAGVRMEDPEVWEVTHAKVVELAHDGSDRRRAGRPSGRPRESAPLPRAAARGGDRRASGSRRSSSAASGCAPEWPVEGTTGYEFLNDVTALFVDPAAEEPLTRLYEG